MTYWPHLPVSSRDRLLHSNVCFLVVPIGLCAGAVLIHWLMHVF